MFSSTPYFGHNFYTNELPKKIPMDECVGRAVGNRDDDKSNDFRASSLEPLWSINSNSYEKFYTIYKSLESMESGHRNDVNSCAIDFADMLAITLMNKEKIWESGNPIGTFFSLLKENFTARKLVTKRLDQFRDKGSSMEQMKRYHLCGRMNISWLIHPLWDKAVEMFPRDIGPKGTSMAAVNSLPDGLITTEYEKDLFGLTAILKCQNGHVRQETLSKLCVMTNFENVDETFKDRVNQALKDLETEKCAQCEKKLSLINLKLGDFLFLDCNMYGDHVRNLTLPEEIQIEKESFRPIGLIKHISNHFIASAKLFDGCFVVMNDMRNEADKSFTLFESCKSMNKYYVDEPLGPLDGVGLVLMEKVSPLVTSESIAHSTGPFDLSGFHPPTCSRLTGTSLSTVGIGLEGSAESSDDGVNEPNKVVYLTKKQKETFRKKNNKIWRQQKRKLQTLEEKGREKELNINQKEKFRKLQSVEEKDREIELQKNRMKKFRKLQSVEENDREKELNRNKKQKFRKLQTVEEKDREKELNRNEKEKFRKLQTVEEKDHEKELNRNEKEKFRKLQTVEEKDREKELNRNEKEKFRKLQTVEEQDREKKIKKKQQKKCRKKTIENKPKIEETVEAVFSQVTSVPPKLTAAEFVFESKSSDVIRMPCKCCKKLLFSDQIVHLSIVTEVSQKIDLGKNDVICYSCKAAINRRSIPSRSWYNMLKLDPVPSVLLNLTFLERRFVCKMQTYMTMLVLPKGGQYAQKGMAVHFPSKPGEIIKILPPNQASSGIVCSTPTFTGVVRAKLIYGALQWLKSNNPLYNDVEINYEFPDCNGDSLNMDQLIETGMVPIDYTFPTLSIKELLGLGHEKVSFPRSTEAPLSFDDTTHAESLAFPWLFPFGRYDFSEKRQIRITMLDYLQSRLLHEDDRFRADIPYLVTAVNRFETKRLKQLCDVFMTVKKSQKQSISASATSTTDVTAVDVLHLQDNSDLMQNSLMFMKSIRGTASYWKDQLFDLLAKMKSIGPPDIFVTLSVDDLNWPELKTLLKSELKEKFVDSVDAVKKAPVTVAQYAVRRFRILLNYIKKSNVLGIVTDYHCRVEFQNRGSMHFHCFFWISNAPSVHKSSPAAEIVTYLDKIVCTELPSEKDDNELYHLVKSRQFHKHTPACKNNKDSKCRFKFPKRICMRTRLLYDVERMKKRGTFYETKRPEGCENLNCYNAKIMKRWRSNMDIQLVNGEHGLAYYVCKNALKAEPEELKSKIGEELQKLNSQSSTQTGRMMRLGMCMLKYRRLTAQEAAFRLCGLEMVFSSRTTVKISTIREEKRLKKLKDIKEIKQIAEDCPSSTDIFKDNAIDTYRKRPKQLEDYTLFQFTSWFDRIPYSSAGTLPLIDQSSNLRKRQPLKFKCIRTSYVSMNTDDYYYSLVLLHYKHRTEQELMAGFNTARESFEAKIQFMNFDNLANDSFVNEVLEAAQRLRLSKALIDLNEEPPSKNGEICDEFECPIEQENNDKQTISEFNEISVGDVENMPSEEMAWQTLTTAQTSTSKLESMISSLSSDQKRCLKYIEHKINSKEQILLVITGNAGSGKSHFLRVLTDYLRLMHAQFPGHNPVITGAYTGLAAKWNYSPFYVKTSNYEKK